MLLVSNSGTFDCTKRHVNMDYVSSGLCRQDCPKLARHCNKNAFNAIFVRHMLCTLSSKADRSTRFTVTTVLGTTGRKRCGFLGRIGVCNRETRGLGRVFLHRNFRLMCSGSLNSPVTSKFCFAVNCPKVADNRLTGRLVCCKIDTVSLIAAKDRRRNLHTYASFVGSRRCTRLSREVGLFTRGRPMMWVFAKECSRGLLLG